ncbi:MAG TPA: hypothetical protein DCS54_02310 [Oribacterium sp.]|jgi:site-specific recombinase XerD|nr:hypothetical protein [Oribacterium sp.]
MSLYRDRLNAKYDELTDLRIQNMPRFMRQYLNAINNKSSGTRNGYINDIEVFFTYLTEKNPLLKNQPLSAITPEFLDQLSTMDLEEYFSDIKYIRVNGDVKQRSSASLKRNLASIRSLYKFLYSHGFIQHNPAVLVESAKLPHHDVVVLTESEKNNMLDSIEYGTGLTDRQQSYHDNPAIGTRDIALLGLMFNTGIRVSECVGLNLSDLNMKEHSIMVHRKNNKLQLLHFSAEVAEYLETYLESFRLRKETLGKTEDTALFLTMYYQRIGVRAIQRLVKKYANVAEVFQTDGHKITPHKLRSTFATEYYQHNPNLVHLQSLMGHSDIKTTQVYVKDRDESKIDLPLRTKEKHRKNQS